MNGLSVSAFLCGGVRLCKRVFADEEATMGTGAQLRGSPVVSDAPSGLKVSSKAVHRSVAAQPPAEVGFTGPSGVHGEVQLRPAPAASASL
ncbi:hypothetical protein HPB47_006922 [Ixodes persulcatus]|uniref:Uncharacterized protein n=1 Tax=Ixodes persulcatus TaxID=34615 RepID=A0AC60P9W1_IXOPE|nr:hypothetical protein HPB47_006922 [Ixodes persulcatus]